MYSRRSMLGGVTLLTAALAGCSDELTDRENSGNGNESSPDLAPSETESIKSDVSLEYSLGLSSLEGGEAGIRVGISDFNMERYEEAVDFFEDAKESFERAESQFSDATDLTFEIDEPEVREITETGESHASLLQDAANEFEQAADRAAEGGDPDIVNSRLEQGESYESEAYQSEPRDQSVLDDALGIE